MGFHYMVITAIVVFGISIVGQSFGELLVLRQLREATCLSEDDDSAFIWNGVSGASDTLGFQPVKPKQKSDPQCAIWSSTECRAHWKNINGWEEVGSGFRPMAPVLDFRWEDFGEFTGDSHIDHSQYQYMGSVNESSGSVAFSARGQKNLNVLLCKNINPTTGPCFWMVIGGWEGKTSVMRFCEKGGPMPRTAPTGDNCNNTDKKEHGNEGLLDPFEWHTFRLTWSRNEKRIQIIKDIGHDEEPILRKDIEKKWPDVSHMSIRLDTTTRVRFHFYKYLVTEKKDSVLYSEEFYHHKERFCFKLLLGLCEKCKLSVKLVDNSGRSFEIGDISGGERSASDGTLMWRSVELSKNLKDYDHEFEEPFRLEVRTILTEDEAKGQWVIDNFRTCKPGGQRRKSTIYSPPKLTDVVCQKLSYNESTVIYVTSASRINASTHESQQLIDKSVEQCGSSCKNFNEDSLLCNSTGCTCNRGFRGTDCSKTCPVGYYGYNCDGICEICIIGTCDKITGLCATRCPSNTLLPPLCQTEIEKSIVTNITDTTAVIAQKIELETSVNANVEVTIQVKEFRSDFWMNFTAKLEGSVMPFYYKSDISNLTLDTVYKYRTIVSVILANDTIPVTGPEMNFTTTCFMQPNFTVTPEETTLTVVLENERECIHDAGSDYLVLVYDPVNNISLYEYPRVRFPSVYDKLTPDTDYNVTIFNTRINKKLLSIKKRTLEAAPSEVENLRAESTTEYTTTLRWDPPRQRDGWIRYYNVSLTGKLIACEEGERGKLRYEPLQIVNGTSLTISGLHPYANYTATVIAHNIKPGKSRAEVFQTLETNIPQSKFSNFTLGNNNQTFYWNKSASDCTTVTGSTGVARLSIENIDDPTKKSESLKQTTNEQCQISLFGNLTPYTRYKVRLYVARKYNGPINLTNYQELTWRTSPIEPPRVERLEIYDADIETNAISLRWVPPYPAYGELESYKVSFQQREKLILSKDVKVLEEGLKCELSADYVCLRNFIFPNVIAGNDIYKIEVRAFNKEVSKPGAPNDLRITSEIYKQKPNDPKNLTSISQDYGIVKLSWTRCRFTSTKITGFYIKVKQASTKLLTNKTHEVFMEHSAATNQTEYSVELHLMTSTDYNVSIVAVNWLNFTSEESKILISVPGSIVYEHGTNVTIKQIENFIQVLAPEVVNATKNTTVDVTVHGIITCQAVNSPILSPPIKSKKWLAAVYKLEENKPKNLTIGNIHDQLNCTIDMSDTYHVELTATDWFSGSTARLKSAPITSQIPVPPSRSNLAWLVIFPIILAICMVLIFVAYRKCKRVPKQPSQPGYVEPISLLSRPTGSVNNSTHINIQEVKPTIPQRPSYLEIIAPSPTTTSINNWPALDTTTSSSHCQPKATEDQSSDHVYIVPNEPDFCSVSMKNFAVYAESAATSRRLHSQFLILHRILPSSPCEYGRLLENVAKNRNGSMPACDHSRVVLEKIPGDPYSDYINASYIKGYEKERAYIAAQGPKPNTVDDFWRMIWQDEVRVICMLTNIIEGGETKCEKYWPDVGTRMKYGKVSVSNTNDQVYADYTFRTFELSYGQETRKVTHLHYTGWPELGVPTYPQSLVDYLRKLEQTPDGNGPVIVHCSTGDDRTGTIILCAICLRQALAEKVIDVMAVTARMRESRANMVGTLEQYVLAHVIITESLTSWPTQIPCSDVLSNRMNKLRIQLPFDMRRLSDTTWQLQALQSSAAASPCPTKHLTNDKNPEIVQDKPEVIYDDVIRSERNQINAVIVDGVKAKKQYLACWLPSPLTLPNFWEFVVERDMKLIIILQCSNPKDPTCYDIMPDESITVPLLKIEVEKQPGCDKGEYFTNEKLRLTETSEANARSQSLTVLTCKGWGCGTIQKPPTPTALISLWQASEKITRKEGQTLVLCHDGVTGCGLYLAMSFLLEQMAVERKCDVISAVRAVRRSNPKFVQLTEQCEYLYDAAQAYAECFQHYANFS